MSVSIGRPVSSAAVASLSASGSYRSSVKPLGIPVTGSKAGGASGAGSGGSSTAPGLAARPPT
eukprot:10015314-Alexandrium_andersonii.AAC.1